jgi:hypothetical protein
LLHQQVKAHMRGEPLVERDVVARLAPQMTAAHYSYKQAGQLSERYWISRKLEQLFRAHHQSAGAEHALRFGARLIEHKPVPPNAGEYFVPRGEYLLDEYGLRVTANAHHSLQTGDHVQLDLATASVGEGRVHLRWEHSAEPQQVST